MPPHTAPAELCGDSRLPFSAAAGSSDDRRQLTDAELEISGAPVRFFLLLLLLLRRGDYIHTVPFRHGFGAVCVRVGGCNVRYPQLQCRRQLRSKGLDFVNNTCTPPFADLEEVGHMTI